MESIQRIEKEQIRKNLQKCIDLSFTVKRTILLSNLEVSFLELSLEIFQICSSHYYRFMLIIIKQFVALLIKQGNESLQKYLHTSKFEVAITRSFFHCVENVQIRSFFRSVFLRIRTEYGRSVRNEIFFPELL